MARVTALIPSLGFSALRGATPTTEVTSDVDAHLTQRPGFVVLHQLVAPKTVAVYFRLLHASSSTH